MTFEKCISEKWTEWDPVLPPNVPAAGEAGAELLAFVESLEVGFFTYCSPVLVDVPPPNSSSSLSYTGEVQRKALHLLALVIPLGMAWLGSPVALYVVGGGALFAIGADVLRAYSAPFSEWIRWIFGPLMRKEELPDVGTGITFNGATCVLVGAALLALLFPLRVAVPVLTMTMLADAAAALVGRRWGRHPWGTLSSTVEGSAAFLVTGAVVMFAFGSFGVLPAAAGVCGAAFVEALPLPINDNIRVPLIAAALVLAVEVLAMGAFPAA